MANIVLIGYGVKAEDMKSRILGRIRAIGETDMDSPLINTNVTIESVEVKDIAGNQPRVRIESSKETDFDKVVEILRGLKIPLKINTLKLRSEIDIRP